MQVSSSSYYFIFLGPDNFLDILFSNAVIVRTSLNVKDQLSHPYKTAGKKLYSSVHCNLNVVRHCHALHVGRVAQSV